MTKEQGGEAAADPRRAGDEASLDGWEELAELTGGVRPDEVGALRDVRPRSALSWRRIPG